MTRVIVTAIRQRAPFVNYLGQHIPNLEVVWDKTSNAMNTFMTACRMANDDPVIRLEDDICLTEDFLFKAYSAISERPNDVIQFFSRSKHDLTEGSRYKAGSSFSMNQCNYLPASVSAGLIEYYKIWKRKDEHPTGYDLLMADYFKDMKIKYWLHTPSLVDHAQVRSEIDPRRSRFRQSTTFVKPEYRGYPL
jgi:hypothetical protein